MGQGTGKLCIGDAEAHELWAAERRGKGEGDGIVHALQVHAEPLEGHSEPIENVIARLIPPKPAPVIHVAPVPCWSTFKDHHSGVPFSLTFDAPFDETDHEAFKKDLLGGFKALGATDATLAEVSVELRAGSIIASISGPEPALSALHVLELDELKVLGYGPKPRYVKVAPKPVEVAPEEKKIELTPEQLRLLEEIKKRANVDFDLDNGRMKVLKEMAFEPRKSSEKPVATLRDPKALVQVFNDIAAISALLAGSFLTIEGHTGGGQSNFWQQLADDRARLVSRELTKRGHSADKIKTVGKPGKTGLNKTEVIVQLSMPPPPVASKTLGTGFNGSWENKGGTKTMVHDHVADRTDFKVVTDSKCQMSEHGSTYHGTLDGDTITWDDGDVWHRCKAVVHDGHHVTGDMKEELSIINQELRKELAEQHAHGK